MSLISAGSISLDSTFNINNPSSYLLMPLSILDSHFSSTYSSTLIYNRGHYPANSSSLCLLPSLCLPISFPSRCLPLSLCLTSPSLPFYLSPLSVLTYMRLLWLPFYVPSNDALYSPDWQPLTFLVFPVVRETLSTRAATVQSTGA